MKQVNFDLLFSCIKITSDDLSFAEYSFVISNFHHL